MSILSSIPLFYALVLSFTTSVHGFTTGGLARQHYFPEPNSDGTDVLIVRSRKSKNKESTASSSAVRDGDEVSPVADDKDEENAEGNESSADGDLRRIVSVTSRVKTALSATASNAMYLETSGSTSSWMTSIGTLLKMIKPAKDIIGVLCLHLIGIQRTLSTTQQSSINLLKTLVQPRMLGVLYSLILLSVTSTVVNNQYDTRNGAAHRFSNVSSVYARRRNNNKKIPSIDTTIHSWYSIDTSVPARINDESRGVTNNGNYLGVHSTQKPSFIVEKSFWSVGLDDYSSNLLFIDYPTIHRQYRLTTTCNAQGGGTHHTNALCDSNRT